MITLVINEIIKAKFSGKRCTVIRRHCTKPSCHSNNRPRGTVGICTPSKEIGAHILVVLTTALGGLGSERMPLTQFPLQFPQFIFRFVAIVFHPANKLRAKTLSLSGKYIFLKYIQCYFYCTATVVSIKFYFIKLHWNKSIIVTWLIGLQTKYFIDPKRTSNSELGVKSNEQLL